MTGRRFPSVQSSSVSPFCAMVCPRFPSALCKRKVNGRSLRRRILFIISSPVNRIRGRLPSISVRPSCCGWPCEVKLLCGSFALEASRSTSSPFLRMSTLRLWSMRAAGRRRRITSCAMMAARWPFPNQMFGSCAGSRFPAVLRFRNSTSSVTPSVLPWRRTSTPARC